MTRNLWLLLGVSLFFGIATGIYEFILPYFLKAHGISFAEMGLIFALAGLAMFLARLYMGGLADRWGRKGMYGLALAACGAATAITAMLPALLWQFLLKTFRETAALTREAIHPIILFEENNNGFLNRIGKFRGMEFLFQAGGTLLAGGLLAVMAQQAFGRVFSYQLVLYLAGAVLVTAGIIWLLTFHENWRPVEQAKLRLRELLNLDLHPNLRLLLISGLIFTFGMQLSHSFYMMLFFQERFGKAESLIAVIMMLHRVSIALPMLVVGNLPLKNLRAWYIAALVVEGVTMSASALIPVFWLSAGVFLLHDFIGAGIWAPIQASMIQRYSRSATRGVEVSKVLAWGSLGAVAGPLAAGYLAGIAPIWPFFFSGLFMALSAIPLFWADLRAPSPDEPAAEPEPVAA